MVTILSNLASLYIEILHKLFKSLKIVCSSKLFTQTSKYFYTDISVIFMKFCNSVSRHTLSEIIEEHVHPAVILFVIVLVDNIVTKKASSGCPGVISKILGRVRNIGKAPPNGYCSSPVSGMYTSTRM